MRLIYMRFADLPPLEGMEKKFTNALFAAQDRKFGQVHAGDEEFGSVRKK